MFDLRPERDRGVYMLLVSTRVGRSIVEGVAVGHGDV